jgi:hypothetical protein
MREVQLEKRPLWWRGCLGCGVAAVAVGLPMTYLSGRSWDIPKTVAFARTALAFGAAWVTSELHVGGDFLPQALVVIGLFYLADAALAVVYPIISPM